MESPNYVTFSILQPPQYFTRNSAHTQSQQYVILYLSSTIYHRTTVTTPSESTKTNQTKMKFTTIVSLSTLSSVAAFTTTPTAFQRKAFTTTGLEANIRGPTDKAEELRFGWDGTTALGGAVEVAKPSRMLQDIREAGEEIPNDCEVFNANVEMSGDDLMFEEVIEVSRKEIPFVGCYSTSFAPYILQCHDTY